MSEQQTRQSAEPAPVPHGATAHTIRCHGIKMRYLEWSGPANATRPPVLLLHGILQTSEGMANVADHLARSGRVIAPDLRGRGGTDQPASGYDPATLASDVAALIEAIRLTRPVVIGRMHGGLVGYYLAARHPSLIGGLVIGDTPPEVSPERAATVLTVVRNLPARFASLDDAIAFYQDTLKLSEARARHDIPHDLIADDDGGWRWRHNLALVVQIEEASMPRAAWDTVARISCPTLIIRGQRGEISSTMAERLAAMIPRCQITTILGARHDLFLGPGCEQTFGAIDLFLMRFNHAGSHGRSIQAATVAGAAVDAPTLSSPEAAIAHLIEAINARNQTTFEAVFAPSVHVVQFGEGGKVREGGREAARAAFGRVTSGSPNAMIAVQDLVVTGAQAACVFTIWNPVRQGNQRVHHLEPRATLIPAFLQFTDGKITELTTYHLHVPISQIDGLAPATTGA